MGVGSFPITNPTVTGGTAILDLQRLLDQLENEGRLGRAAVGQDLFSSLLGAQTEANRRPISLVNQLALSGQVGSQFPLSQASQDQLNRFRTPNQNPLLQRLIDRLDIFSERALDEGQRSEARRREVASDFGDGAFIGDVQGRVKRLAHGGQLIIAPGKATGARKPAGAIAGPVSINDRTGRTVAIAGEGGGAETIDVKPIPDETIRSIGPAGTALLDPKAGLDDQRGTNPVGENVALDLTLPDNLSRTERFRSEELLRLRPDLGIERIVAIARSPAGLEALAGTETDPRAAAARLIGEAIGQDNRFSDAFVRSLSLGRSPAPGTEATARDFTTLSPDLQESLKSLIGPDLFSQFAFELNSLSPTGTRARQAVTGGVRV